MFKPIMKTFLPLIIICSCGDGRKDNVIVSSTGCWPELESGTKISGVFLVYYFPEDRAFALKRECKPSSVGLVYNFRNNATIQRELKNPLNKNAVGYYGYFWILGRVFNNPGDKEPLISVSEMKAVNGGSVKTIVYRP